MINKVLKAPQKIFNYNEFSLRIWVLLSSCSFAFFYPIIYGAGFYADDFYRINVVEKGFLWNSLRRYFATYIAQFYSQDTHFIIDAAPLTWVLSIFLIGLSGVLIFCKLNRNYQKFALILSVVFIINPFFVQNLLYRFDSLGMFLGLFFAVLAFSLNSTKKHFIIRVLLLVISLNFYQTFSNIFISLVAIELLLMAYVSTGTEVLKKYLLEMIGVFMLANAIYYIELVCIGVPSRGELLPFSIGSIPTIVNNYINALMPFFTFWSFFKVSGYLFAFFTVLSLLTSKISLKMVGVILLSCLILFISTAGLMALLQDSFVAPRTLHYFSPIMMLCSIILLTGNKKFKWFILLPIFVCFIFNYRVGNMQKIQSEFEKPIAYATSLDLFKNRNIKKYYSIGSIPFSHFIKKIRLNTPFNGFMSRNSWKTVGVLNEYTPLNLIKFEWSSQAKKRSIQFKEEKSAMNLLIDRSPYYKIYEKDDEGWILWL